MRVGKKKKKVTSASSDSLRFYYSRELISFDTQRVTRDL